MQWYMVQQLCAVQHAFLEALFPQPEKWQGGVALWSKMGDFVAGVTADDVDNADVAGGQHKLAGRLNQGERHCEIQQSPPIVAMFGDRKAAEGSKEERYAHGSGKLEPGHSMSYLASYFRFFHPGLTPEQPL